jgi:hypothetical protein
MPSVDRSFVPYGTNGYWINTEYGTPGCKIIHGDGHRFTTDAGFMMIFTDGCGCLTQPGGLHG